VVLGGREKRSRRSNRKEKEAGSARENVKRERKREKELKKIREKEGGRSGLENQERRKKEELKNDVLYFIGENGVK
jgi:spore cortex formation protein SpoVR/YcgB (stage V sporulation)